MCMLPGASCSLWAIQGAQRDLLKPREQEALPEGELEARCVHPCLPHSINPVVTGQVSGSSVFLLHQACPWGNRITQGGLRGFGVSKAAKVALGNETQSHFFLPSFKVHSFLLFFFILNRFLSNECCPNSHKECP